MTKFTSHQGTFDEENYPLVLYKYRDLDKENHHKWITNREVFLASPNAFEDKNDCKIPVRYDLLNEKQSIDFFVRHSKVINPKFSRQQHRKEARIWLKDKRLKNQAYIENFRNYYNTEYDKRMGVLCLTDEPALEEMWQKYSNNSQGFCVGYNSRILFALLGGGGKVNYYEQLPIILPEPIMSNLERNYYSIFSKESKWSFEKEYRTYTFFENPTTIDDRKVKLPKEAFNNIILGKNISSENKTQIINAVREHIGDIPIVDQTNI